MDLNDSEIIKNNHTKGYDSNYGSLYQGDCMSLLSKTKDETFDLIFADPPFNLNKLYPSGMDDNLSTMEYINWTKK